MFRGFGEVLKDLTQPPVHVPVPAAGATVAQFPLFGGGTGISSPGAVADAIANQQIKALEDRLRAQEAEIAAQKLHAAATSINSPMDLAHCMVSRQNCFPLFLTGPKPRAQLSELSRKSTGPDLEMTGQEAMKSRKSMRNWKTFEV